MCDAVCVLKPVVQCPTELSIGVAPLEDISYVDAVRREDQNLL